MFHLSTCGFPVDSVALELKEPVEILVSTRVPWKVELATGNSVQAGLGSFTAWGPDLLIPSLLSLSLSGLLRQGL